MSRADPLANFHTDPAPDPLNDFSDFKPQSKTEKRSPEERRAVEEAAKAHGFVGSTPAQEPVVEPGRPRYYRNGRNEPLNFKVTSETKNHLHRLREELDEPLGVILEEALKALEKTKDEVRRRLQHEKSR